MVLSPDNCERHEALCRIPLASGKPCYVDKTFAPTKAAAERIFANAEAHGTPCWSASALRFAAEYQGIDPKQVRAAAAWGPGYGPRPGFETYAIHMLEPVIMLMAAHPTRVLAQRSGDCWYALTIEFGDGRAASITGFADGSPFMMNVAAETGNRVICVESDYFGAFLQALVRFFQTGVPPVEHAATIDIMAVREAGLAALERPGEWVNC